MVQLCTLQFSMDTSVNLWNIKIHILCSYIRQMLFWWCCENTQNLRVLRPGLLNVKIPHCSQEKLKYLPLRLFHPWFGCLLEQGFCLDKMVIS